MVVARVAFHTFRIQDAYDVAVVVAVEQESHKVEDAVAVVVVAVADDVDNT